MEMADIDRLAVQNGSAGINVEFGRIPDACARFGLSRSGLYLLASERKIRLFKLAGRTLVDYASVRSYIASLPAANIKPAYVPQRRTA